MRGKEARKLSSNTHGRPPLPLHHPLPSAPTPKELRKRFADERFLGAGVMKVSEEGKSLRIGLKKGNDKLGASKKMGKWVCLNVILG